MHIHFIIHEHFEAPGAYEVWAEKRGHTITYSRVYQAEPLPKSIEDIDFLIVMGGPQDPSTTIEQCPHFDAKSEQAIILSSITAGKVVLGICLGAQLIGEALGATFEPSPEREIGKYPITLTEAGMQHPLFSHFGQVLDVGHWHNDMPGLPMEHKSLHIARGAQGKLSPIKSWYMAFSAYGVNERSRRITYGK